MTIFIACVDYDGTLHSSPEPSKAFTTREAAENYLSKYGERGTNIVKIELVHHPIDLIDTEGA